MRPQTLGWLLAAALLALPLPARTLAPGEAGAKHHHDLRGVITKVEAEKNRFEIKTDGGRVVLCVTDKETTIKRGTEEITLKQVKPGMRAHCHCAALRNRRHYSQKLRVEQKDE